MYHREPYIRNIHYCQINNGYSEMTVLGKRKAVPFSAPLFLLYELTSFLSTINCDPVSFYLYL